MQTPVYTDFQFVSAPLLTGAEAQTAFSIEDITGSLHTPGLANASAITFTPSGLNVTVVFGSTARVLFGSGVLAGGYGVVNGATSGSYTVNLSSYVPALGSTTVYLVASAIQIGQQGNIITGPSPGHPDYDPTFIPYTAYFEQLDSVLVAASVVAPDNVVRVELCRVVLTAGETTIPSVVTAYQQNAGSVLAQGEAAINVGTLGGALTGTLPNPGLAPGVVIPVGSGIDYWGATAPAGYLFAYGQAISRTTYTSLFAVMGTTYGSGDGSTTFNVPDKRGRSSIGKDDMGGVAANRVTSGGSGVSGTTLGASGGNELTQSHTHTTTENPHSHVELYHPNAFGSSPGPGASGAGGGPSISDLSTEGATTGLTVNSYGSGGSQNLPPGIICNYIIYAGV